MDKGTNDRPSTFCNWMKQTHFQCFAHIKSSAYLRGAFKTVDISHPENKSLVNKSESTEYDGFYMILGTFWRQNRDAKKKRVSL